MNQRLLIGRFLRFHWVPAVALASITAALCLSFGLVGLVRVSATEAVKDSVRAQNAGARFAVQTSDPDAVRTIAGRRDMAPVVERSGVIAFDGREFPIDVRVVTDRAVPGLVIDGRQPIASGEGTVARHLLQALGASLGDVVTIRAGGEIGTTAELRASRIKLVGATVDPADSQDSTVITLDSRLESASATLWLTNTDPFADPELKALTDAGVASGRTVDLLAGDTSSTVAGPLLEAFRYVPLGIAFLAVSILLALLMALSRTVQRGMDGLVAAGMHSQAAWRVAIRSAVLVIFIGSFGGAGLAFLAGWLLRTPISGAIGQDWQHVALAWPTVCGFAAGVTAAVALSANLALHLRNRFVLPRLYLGGRLAIVIAVVSVACLLLPLVRVTPVQTAIGGGLLMVIALPTLLSRLAALWTKPATRRVLATVSVPLMALSLTSALITYGAAYYAAWTGHSAISSERSSAAPQPAGSFLVDRVAHPAQVQLLDAYRQIGGRRVTVYRAPVEASRTLRVTSERVVECMQQQRVKDPNTLSGDCFPQNTASPINTIALSDSRDLDQPLRADPGLVENGRVGLVDFDRKSGKVISTQVVAAVPQAGLGGNLPGAVTGLGGSFASSHDLVDSGDAMIAFLDFEQLSEDDRAGFRATVTRVVPTAPVSEATDPFVDKERAIALGVALIGGGLLTLILAAAGLTYVSSQQRFRRLVVDTGASFGWRRQLAIRIFLLPIGCLLFSAALARLAAWYTGVHDGHGFGWVWTIPCLCGFAVCLGLITAYLRTPQPQST